MENERFKYYLSLINKSYMEVIGILLKKYGAVTDDYYKEKSYARFLNGEIKSIAHGKYKRTKEGLYTHHIAENHAENLANTEYIKHFKYPFELQRKKNLVYADLIEHLILHALITNETDGQFGYSGYSCYLEPMVNEWYTTEMIPKPEWMKMVYKRAFLTEKEVNELFQRIDSVLLFDVKQKEEMYYRLNNIIQECFLEKLKKPYILLLENKQFNLLNEEIINELLTYNHKSTDDEIKKVVEVKLVQYLFSDNELKEREEERKRELKQERIISETAVEEDWDVTHPNLVKNGIFKDTPRNTVLRDIFHKRYETKYKTFKEYRSASIEILKDDLLDELEMIFKEEKN